MYIERKAGSQVGEARIGRVEFSKTGRTMYYNGKEFYKVKGDINIIVLSLLLWKNTGYRVAKRTEKIHFIL